MTLLYTKTVSISFRRLEFNLMIKTDLKYSILTFLLFLTSSVFGSHYMGGEITWKCDGNAYKFQLVLYRDCNGLNINSGTINLNVFNHPSLNSITCNFQEREDLSPYCNAVPGGPSQIDCGTGAQAGTGAGAIEKVVYESNPINISGVPPTNGWIFYWSGFSRNWDVDNIQNPAQTGITLMAKMYPHPSSTPGQCYDSSPQFNQNPLLTVCSGEEFIYNQNASDTDFDQVQYSWAEALDSSSVGTFNWPSYPNSVNYVNGFNANSPTPGTGQNAQNIPASLNTQNGNIEFTSFTQGNFAMNLKVSSYRNGQIISDVYRDIQTVVLPCNNYNNNVPTITAPFNNGNSFDTTIYAGDLVNFDFISEDLELLQDGTPQSNILTPSGSQFGNNFTDPNNGCDTPPCATLNQGLPIIQSQGLNVNFNWQTDCDHLINSQGEVLDEVTYEFVFKVADDYCQLPRSDYETVSITVQNREVLNPAVIQCISVDNNGDVTLEWLPTSDPSGSSFQSYDIYSVEDGFIQTINNINTTTYTHVGADALNTNKNYFIIVNCGCGGVNEIYSDTLTPIVLQLNNTGDGTATLQWNDPITPPTAPMGDYYHIYRLYNGNWVLRDSVAYGTTFYKDTIDICQAFLEYQIRLPNQAGTCFSTSNIEGDDFEDILSPYIPEIVSVSVDPASGLTEINWDENDADDTQGYIIYQLINGFWETVDTVYGINNTYFLNPNSDPSAGPETYSISAFDTCQTNSIPPQFQTSPKSERHTSIYLQEEYLICDKIIDLSWTRYVGWEHITSYQVYSSIDNGPSILETTLDSSKTSFALEEVERNKNYCIYILGLNDNGDSTYSNTICRETIAPGAPDYIYIRTATVVNNDEIDVRVQIDPVAEVSYYVLERYNPAFEDYEQIDSIAPDGISQILFFNDQEQVNANARSYNYRVFSRDTCGEVSATSNEANTIHLRVYPNEKDLVNVLNWNHYSEWDGQIIGYNIYRGVDGVFGQNPIASLSPAIRAFEDPVNNYLNSNGRFCYRIEAIEQTNSFNFAENSFSNVACAEQEVLIYVPNAVYLGGINNEFKPVISYFEYTSYEMVIYDRWGREFFTTKDINTGWRGEAPNAGIAQEGVYVYFITVKDARGDEVQRRGTVTLLHYSNE